VTAAEELAAFKRLLGNRDHRFKRLCPYPIRYEDGSAGPFIMNWAQTELYDGMHYRNQCLKVRKIGISTFWEIYELDSCLFFSNRRCAVIDLTEDDAKKKLAIIKFAWDFMDDAKIMPHSFHIGQWIKSPSGLGLRLVTDSKTELKWNNGSSVYADVSMRGDTPQILHVSELGKIAIEQPERAKEIVSGSFNSVAIGNLIAAESTHKGGRYGINYDYVRLAQSSAGKVRTPLDWKFWFFAWFREPKHRMPLHRGQELQMTPRQAKYFADLERTEKIKLTDEQKHWWLLMSAQPSADMAREFPGTVEEALSAVGEGAVYGEQMSDVRMAGRVREFPADTHAPIYTFWDLGYDDFTCIWLLQLVGLDILALNYRTGWMENVANYAATLLEWETQYHRPITRHFVPHDAAKHDMSGKTTVDLMRECGIERITVVPRTPDRSVGIKHLRALLPRFYFHAVNCERDTKLRNSERRLPSGLACLEGYRYADVAVGGAIKKEPVHDEAGHGADALRTFSEAHMRPGMLEGPSATARESGDGGRARAVGVGMARPAPPQSTVQPGRERLALQARAVGR
jgi:hypothetical protein